MQHDHTFPRRHAPIIRDVPGEHILLVMPRRINVCMHACMPSQEMIPVMACVLYQALNAPPANSYVRADRVLPGQEFGIFYG